MMPARSEPQRRLMAAAAHGATFPKAKQLRQSMTMAQLRDFAEVPPAKVPHRTGKKRVVRSPVRG
jgi:hypothetical protein